MGHNDHIEDDYSHAMLPAAAGRPGPKGFEPDDEWLKDASPDLQKDVMRAWFQSRFQDPAMETPYISAEGGYIYVHGGPYDARDELEGRFGGLVDDEAIEEVIDDLESEGIVEWAPIHTEPDYDAEFQLEETTREDPFRFFKDRIGEVDALFEAPTDEKVKSLLRQLLFTSLIAALESYLADTMSFWISTDKAVFRRFVTGCEEFQKQKLSVSEIFDRMDKLEDDVKVYLQQLVWHRLDKVGPLVKVALGIEIPDIAELMQHVVVRHDIVHRGGKTKDGKTVIIDADRLQQLRGSVLSFADMIQKELVARFPEPDLEF